jgi:hypothetical protein
VQHRRTFRVTAARTEWTSSAPSAASVRARSESSPTPRASAHACRRHATPGSTAPAATAARPASSCPNAAARSPRCGKLGAACSSAAARTPGSGARPELAPEQRPAGVGVLARGAGLARAGEAADQQLVGAVVESAEGEHPRRQRGAIERTTGRQRPKRGISQDRLAHTRDAPALDQQAGVELGAPARVDSLQQVAASKRRVRIAGPQHQHVDRRLGREPQLQRIPPQRARNAEGATQLRQRPAQRTQRVVRVTEDQVRQPCTRNRTLRQQPIRKHGPRLVTPGRRGKNAIALDLRRSHQADHELRHDTRIVDLPAQRAAFARWGRRRGPLTRACSRVRAQ